MDSADAPFSLHLDSFLLNLLLIPITLNTTHWLTSIPQLNVLNRNDSYIELPIQYIILFATIHIISFISHASFDSRYDTIIDNIFVCEVSRLY